MKTILGYEVPMSCETLYLCYLTSENIPCEGRYLVKTRLAATKKAVNRKWGRMDPHHFEELAGHGKIHTYTENPTSQIKHEMGQMDSI